MSLWTKRSSLAECMHAEQKGSVSISMNHIFQYQGYRFYQFSFDPDQQGTILTVRYDPWGTPLTYFGYAMLALSILLVLFNRKEEFMRLLRHPLLQKGALTISLLVCLTPVSTQARSIPTINKEKALAMIEKYNTPEKVAAGLKELRETWDNLLGILNVNTPDDKVDRMVNIWNQYQCMVTFNLSRSEIGRAHV